MEKISTETKTSTRRISSRSSSSSSTRRKSPHKKNKSVSKKMKQNAISWLLHSIKILLGDESIRRYIILKYNPELKNKNHIKTFDAFIKSGKTREHKHKEIKKYLQAISRLKKDIVVFTATNVQKDEEDIETHFQSFIVDNNNKKVYGIDPAYDKNEEDFIGIYYAEILHETIKPANFLAKKITNQNTIFAHFHKSFSFFTKLSNKNIQSLKFLQMFEPNYM